VAMFKDSGHIICHVGEELIVNGKNIKTDIEKVTKHFVAREWHNFGFHIGIIIGDVLSPTAQARSVGDFDLTMDFSTVAEIFEGVLGGFVHESLPGLASFIKDQGHFP